MLDEHILDYYHLQEHVVNASQVLYGEGTHKARAWCETMMSVVWEQGSLGLLHRLDAYGVGISSAVCGEAGADDGLPGVPKTGLRLRVGSDRIDVRDANRPA